jgi:hypothetical protein
MTGHSDRLETLFDPERRDSVIASIRAVMAEHVDGRDSKMARLLDLSHEGSPLRSIVDERASQRNVERREALLPIEHGRNAVSGRDLGRIVVGLALMEVCNEVKVRVLICVFRLHVPEEE